MAYIRLSEIYRRRVKPQKLADGATWDDVFKPAENHGENFTNLFEVPVLFYVAALVIHSADLGDSTYATLAWVFVIFRILHSLIHCTYDRVVHRASAYAVSCVAVLVMWIRITAHLLS